MIFDTIAGQQGFIPFQVNPYENPNIDLKPIAQLIATKQAAISKMNDLNDEAKKKALEFKDIDYKGRHETVRQIEEKTNANRQQLTEYLNSVQDPYTVLRNSTSIVLPSGKKLYEVMSGINPTKEDINFAETQLKNADDIEGSDKYQKIAGMAAVDENGDVIPTLDRNRNIVSLKTNQDFQRQIERGYSVGDDSLKVNFGEISDTQKEAFDYFSKAGESGYLTGPGIKDVYNPQNPEQSVALLAHGEAKNNFNQLDAAYKALAAGMSKEAKAGLGRAFDESIGGNYNRYFNQDGSKKIITIGSGKSAKKVSKLDYDKMMFTADLMEKWKNIFTKSDVGASYSQLKQDDRSAGGGSKTEYTNQETANYSEGVNAIRSANGETYNVTDYSKPGIQEYFNGSSNEKMTPLSSITGPTSFGNVMVAGTTLKVNPSKVLFKSGGDNTTDFPFGIDQNGTQVKGNSQWNHGYLYIPKEEYERARAAGELNVVGYKLSNGKTVSNDNYIDKAINEASSKGLTGTIASSLKRKNVPVTKQTMFNELMSNSVYRKQLSSNLVGAQRMSVPISEATWLGMGDDEANPTLSGFELKQETVNDQDYYLIPGSVNTTAITTPQGQKESKTQPHIQQYLYQNENNGAIQNNDLKTSIYNKNSK